MSPERWQQVDELYHKALEKKPEERDAFLVKACQGDEDLRREVQSLLNQNTSGDGLLNCPIWKSGVSSAIKQAGGD